MSDQDNDKWKKKKKEPFLHPRLLEKSLIDDDDRFKDFDDLHPPRRDPEGCRKLGLWLVWSTITLVFFILMLIYWLRWRPQ